MNRRRPLLWVVMLLVGLLVVVAWRVTTSGSKGNGKKERVIVVGTIAPMRQDLDVHGQSLGVDLTTAVRDQRALWQTELERAVGDEHTQRTADLDALKATLGRDTGQQQLGIEFTHLVLNRDDEGRRADRHERDLCLDIAERSTIGAA